MTGTFYIPKTMANWPWQRAINPHYEEMKAESNAWLKTFKPFNEKSQIAFDKCDFGARFEAFSVRHCSCCPLLARLASLAYPYASKGKQMPANSATMTERSLCRASSYRL